jgi:RimJ/RimL family protein N-acetyltransferase
MIRAPFRSARKVRGFYELNRFPGNSQIVVSNHTFLNKEERGKGLCKILMQTKKNHAKELGFDYMISTIAASNEPMIKAALKNGYKELDRFYNHETEREIIIFGMSLGEY